MHKKFPNLFVFLDQYDNKVFKNNNINIGVIYRNYNTANREIELEKIAKACKKKRYYLFVSNSSKLALKFRANGIYIPAFNKTKRFSNLEKRNLIILGSAHSQKEIQEKIKQKCNGLFLSPAFFVKKSNKYLNVHKFNFLSRSNKINIYALGGINENTLQKLNLLHIKGLGGMQIFKKKTGLLRPVSIKKKFF